MCVSFVLLFFSNIIYWLFYLSPTEAITIQIQKRSKQKKKTRDREGKKATWTINQFIIIVNLSGGCDIDTLQRSEWSRKRRRRKKPTLLNCNQRSWICYWFSLLRCPKCFCMVLRPWNENLLQEQEEVEVAGFFPPVERWDVILSLNVHIFFLVSFGYLILSCAAV